MKPTATATERLKPSHHISHRPPASANGTDSMTIKVSVTRRKFKYSSRKMTKTVTGTTIFSRALARSMYSN